MADRHQPQTEQYTAAESSGRRETPQHLPGSRLEAGGPAGGNAPVRVIRETSPQGRRGGGPRPRMRRERSVKATSAVVREDSHQQSGAFQGQGRRGRQSVPLGTQHQGRTSSAVQASGEAARRMSASGASTSGALHPQDSTTHWTPNPGPFNVQSSRRQRGRHSGRQTSQVPILHLSGAPTDENPYATPPRRMVESRTNAHQGAGRGPIPPIRHPSQMHGRGHLSRRDNVHRRARAAEPRVPDDQQAESLGIMRSQDVSVPRGFDSQPHTENNAHEHPGQSKATAEVAELPSAALEVQPPWREMADAVDAPVGSGGSHDEEHACVVCSCPITVRSMISRCRCQA